MAHDWSRLHAREPALRPADNAPGRQRDAAVRWLFKHTEARHIDGDDGAVFAQVEAELDRRDRPEP